LLFSSGENQNKSLKFWVSKNSRVSSCSDKCLD